MPAPREKKISAAIDRLTAEGATDLAAAVKELAEDYEESRTFSGPTVPFKAEAELLEAVGEGRVNRVVFDGVQAFLRGELEPVRTRRTGTKASTSVRLPEDLVARLKAACAMYSEEADWKALPVNVFVAALEAEAARRHPKRT